MRFSTAASGTSLTNTHIFIYCSSFRVLDGALGGMLAAGILRTRSAGGLAELRSWHRRAIASPRPSPREPPKSYPLSTDESVGLRIRHLSRLEHRGADGSTVMMVVRERSVRRPGAELREQEQSEHEAGRAHPRDRDPTARLTGWQAAER